MIIVENALTVSLDSVVFVTFAFTVRPNKSWRTEKTYTQIFFTTSSTEARSIHQNSVLNLAKAFNLSNFRLAKVKFVYEFFDYKNFLTSIPVDC